MSTTRDPDYIDAWHEESWSFHGGTHHEDAGPGYVDYCIFEDGVHYPGVNCPHTEDEDPGWTVLDLRRPNE